MDLPDERGNSEYPPGRGVVERAIDALRDVPGFMRRQKENPFHFKVMGALGGELETKLGERMGEKEAARYILDNQDLVWFEVELSGIRTRRTSS